MNKFQKSLAVIIAITTYGCIDVVKNPLQSPEEAIAEITTLGITLTSEDRPFPANADQQYFRGSPAYVHARLTWYFSPHPDYSEIEGDSITGLLVDDFIFEYRFTIENNDEFITIPSTNGFDPNNSSTSYSGTAGISDSVSELIIIGNYNLRGSPVSVPVTATHIELWMKVNQESEETLVNRVSLESLTAWRLYFKPLIDDNR